MNIFEVHREKGTKEQSENRYLNKYILQLEYYRSAVINHRTIDHLSIKSTKLVLWLWSLVAVCLLDTRGRRNMITGVRNLPPYKIWQTIFNPDSRKTKLNYRCLSTTFPFANLLLSYVPH